MKNVVIDSSTLISLSMNCLIGILDKMHESLGIQFVITPDIRQEVIEDALRSDRFRLGGVRVMKRLCSGVITVEESDISQTNHILDMANSLLTVKGNNFSVVHKGEMSLIPLARMKGSEYIIIDERMTEKIITDPERLKHILENRLHMDVSINSSIMHELHELTKDLTVIKSSDLLAIAYEKGLLDDFTRNCPGRKIKQEFINGALWGLKNEGCAISTLDISAYMKELF